MSLLTVIQAACGELGLTQPASIFGNTDPQIIQLNALAQTEGEEFSAIRGKWSGWPELRKEYTFNLNPVGPYTGNTVLGSPVITNMSSTTNLVAGYGVTGTGLYPYMVIKSVDSGTQVTLTAPAASTTTGSSMQFGQIAYALPTDIQYFIGATHWDRNFRWQMLGPLSAQEWQTIISGISPVGPRLRFRVMGGKMYIQPVPGATQTDLISYEYISNQWCNSAGGTGQTAWAADSDTYVWPERTLKLGAKWRFLRAKGLDYTEEKRSYDLAVDNQVAISGGSRTLPLNATARGTQLLGSQNLPDTGYGT